MKALTDKTWDRFIAAMDDDFNTALALAAVFDLCKEVNSLLNQRDFRGGAATVAALQGLLALFAELDQVCAVLVPGEGEQDDLSEALLEIIVISRATRGPPRIGPPPIIFATLCSPWASASKTLPTAPVGNGKRGAFDDGKRSGNWRLPSLTLAYIGDGVYEPGIRRHSLESGVTRAEKLHEAAVKLVRADFQSRCFGKLEPHLTPEERDLMFRGRNAKSGRQPKHAEMADYRRATGVALIGYVYLSGDAERLDALFALIFRWADEMEEEGEAKT